MGEATKISWATDTFNAWWGCEKVSAACDHCYAEALAKRYGHAVWGEDSPRRFFGDKHWNEPRRWDRNAGEAGVRRRVFCSSMADVFEDRRDLDEHRARLWDLMVETPNLDWLLLTKRPENVTGMVPPAWLTDPPANWWQGTTVENQRRANERVPVLVGIPAAVRFLSGEPLLGPVRLRPEWLVPQVTICGRPEKENHEARRALMAVVRAGGKQFGWRGVDWVLVGGESGSGARRMKPEWALSLAEQCDASGVAFHFKQLGAVLAKEIGVKPPGAHLTSGDSVPTWMLRQELPA